MFSLLFQIAIGFQSNAESKEGLQLPAISEGTVSDDAADKLYSMVEAIKISKNKGSDELSVPLFYEETSEKF